MALRSLHIGVNEYPGTGQDLAGCVNDAYDWQDLLTRRGYETGTLLNAEATLAGMTHAIGDLCASARPGDTVILTYSGHGTWTTDYDGDEPDHRDEALCPTDIMTTGPLLDDTLEQLFSQAADGVKLVFISDSCHSGTVTRLMKPLNPLGTTRYRRTRFLAPSVFVHDSRAISDLGAVEQVALGRGYRHTALLLAGCRDTEFSYDAWFGVRPNGAFTRTAIDMLKRWGGKAPTYRQWWQTIREALPSQDYPQAPQLFGTEAQKQWSAP